MAWKLFCDLDDNDILSALKQLDEKHDPVLSRPKRMLINRRLLKARLQAEPFEPFLVEKYLKDAARYLKYLPNKMHLILFLQENIPIRRIIRWMKKLIFLFKDGTVRDISQVDNALIHRSLSTAVKKFYICYLKGE